MSTTHSCETIESTDSLYEALLSDYPELTLEIINQHIEELHMAGYLQKKLWEDEWLYHASDTSTWKHIAQLSCPIKKKLMIQLIDDPDIFFVLYNTQKGKLRIAGRKLFEASQDDKYKIVAFMMVSNDQALASQTTDGLYECFPLRTGHEEAHISDKHQVQLFPLASNTKTSFREIRTYIDAYASPYATGDTYMPIIPALANNKQMKKVVSMLYYIQNHGNPTLRAIVLWDEADSIYPGLRNQKFRMEDSTEVSFIDLMTLKNSRIYKTGFITATEGELLEEYDECSNAMHYRTELSVEDAPDYRAIHTKESVLHPVTSGGREDNNSLCTRIIESNWDTHFSVPIALPSGETYYRKTIINSTSKTEDHADLARVLVKHGSNCITFNQRGLTLVSANPAIHGKRIPIRKRRFGEVLFSVYKMFGLNTLPLFIIGRRKIDRGLGFHWAPRRNTPDEKRKKEIVGPYPGSPVIRTDGREGLIWTDVILGNRILNIATATQKAGRGAGIIAQCPQYPGNIHYWGTSETLNAVKAQAAKVDLANTLPGTYTMLQAVETAKALLPKERVKRHNVDPATFRIIKAATNKETLDLAKALVVKMGHRFNTPSKKDDAGRYKTTLNDTAHVRTLLEVVKAVPSSYGGKKNGFRYAIPAYVNNDLYMVISLIDPSISDVQKSIIDSDYTAYMVTYPQEEECETISHT